MLLTQGAKCILSYKDILRNYPNFKIKEENKISTQNIPEEYKIIYTALTTTPMEINILAKKTNIQLNELQYKLTLMEIENLVLKYPNNSWSKQQPTLGTR